MVAALLPMTANADGESISESTSKAAPDSAVTPTVEDNEVGIGLSDIEDIVGYGNSKNSSNGRSGASTGGRPDEYVTSRELGVNSKFECSDLPPDSNRFRELACGVGNMACTLSDILAPEGEGYVPTETVRIDTVNDEEDLLGFNCLERGAASQEGSAPVVITITVSDFQSMPVAPLVASAGPEDGWLPVSMVNVLHADADSQTLETEVLTVPVSVRAVPVSYHWDLGDGNEITTKSPGEAYPSEEVSGTYAGEGWYDVTLTTTFSGQFAVNGGPWQDIDGTIEVASEPIPIYSKSLESRLVDGDVPVDEQGDPWIPERTPETEGPIDPEATHREI
ncbi:PKD domain-containing protein [Brachybacterium sp. FME24]|uniref:PKD domain-containing protein n=1 Tax=Brachybacterium sp. FME24 TaxID=2742605 RepID=UPI001D00F7C5|nr:PKD domain-containing protein [Brachybacterium sp. FME24]